MFESRISVGAKEKLTDQSFRGNLMQKQHLLGPMTWKVTRRNVWTDIANLQIKRLNNYTKSQTPCMDDHQFKEEENESQNCSEMSVVGSYWETSYFVVCEQLARAVAKWTQACDKRLVRLISYIHHACEFRQYCCVGNTAQQCRIGLFQDSDFPADLEDSKSTSGGILCISGSHTFVPTSRMCKKQTSVSHSSTEAEIISLDAGLRIDGIPALTLRDLVIEAFHSVANRTDGLKRELWRNLSAVVKSNMHNSIPIKHTNVIPTNRDHIP